MVKTINLSEFSKIQKFVQEISQLNADVDAVRGRYTIDCKSIMGLYSLDLSKPLDVSINSNNSAVINQFIDICERYK